MRLGFVGVGRHAQKMAAAFRECGAEVVAFDRKQRNKMGWLVTSGGPQYMPEPVDGFGASVPWPDMIASPDIDALIICAPPEVTTEVALACAKAGKRCVATKPLMVTRPPDNFSGHRQCVYVDLWRIYSPAWQTLKAELRGKQIQSVHVDFYGNGPVRSFSGLLDYGPHALAFVADLLGQIPPMTWKHEVDTYRGYRCCAWGTGERVTVTTGNSFPEPRICIEMETASGRFIWEESCEPDMLGEQHLCILGHNTPVMMCDRSLALRAFCRAFLSGEPSDTLRLSCEAMKVLMPLVS